jgi:2-amino-4-hydroxy-6-hydroxymethyldihydropteridine diphosphokinase
MRDDRCPATAAGTPVTVVVALGSNLGDSIGTLRAAMDRLESLSVSPLRRSSFWRSTPVDCPPGSSDFVNAVVMLQPLPGETPESLLHKLQRLEAGFGRRPRQVLNEPRPLDLDLITFGAERRASPRLTLPHPRAHLRGFVLAPLAEIAPDLVLPGQRETASEALAGLELTGTVARLGC